MFKRVLLTFLLAGSLVIPPSLVCAANDGRKAAREADLGNLPAALLGEVQKWAESADFWKLVERGERLAARLEVLTVKSNALEAWVCGQTKICVSTRLLQAFNPESQQAVVAHELGHLLIPRNYSAHPQLWEAQCDLFAVAFLRDAEQIKRMLLQLGEECASCQDSEHPVPSVRAALVEHYSLITLTEVLKFDEFRRRSYAVQFRGKPPSTPRGLQQLSFSIKNALSAPAYLGELKSLNFAIHFHPSKQKQ